MPTDFTSKHLGRRHLPRTQPIKWLLVFMSVVILALAMTSYCSGCAFDPGTTDILEVCEEKDHAGIPVQTNGQVDSRVEPRLIWSLPPTKDLNQPDLEVDHPPPKRA
jgi:hypothetical protein